MFEQINIQRKAAGKRALPVAPGIHYYLANPKMVLQKSGCSCGGACPKCQLSKNNASSQYLITQPNDRYEQEADRVADQVMRMSVTDRQNNKRNTWVHSPNAPLVQRLSMGEEFVQRKSDKNTLSESTPVFSDGSRLLRSEGSPLSSDERDFFESRFGRDFSQVRIHADHSADGIAQQINAQAFTIGNDIMFAKGYYAPQSYSGRQLLAHELAHIIQQRPQPQYESRDSKNRPEIRHRLPKNSIAGAWRIVQSPRRSRMPNPLVPTGQTDEQLLLAGFREICPLATLSSGEISVPLAGAVPTARQQGCRCLRDIERVLPTMKSTNPPATIQAEPQGWSSTNPGADPVWVKVRHPDDPFSWGYWTNITEQDPYERRHQKPFWQTLAHEVCGHVWTFIRTRGRHSGGRGTNPRDHDPAIENENLIAGEHGVLPAEQRGFQHERGDRPATRHAGESFLAANVSGYQHGSAALAPTNAPAVIQSAASTVAQMPVFIELEGFAHANEGGQAVATARSTAVMTAMITGARIPATFIPRRSTQRVSRFRNLAGKVSPGNSQQGVPSAGRKVSVYLFHNPRSAQHQLLPAKVYFDTNSTTVRSVSMSVLDTVAAVLAANPTLTIELIGRADTTGQASYNLSLAQLRAESVAQELLRRGVNASQIRGVLSQGQTRARAQSQATRWQDRHVEIRV